MASTSVDYVARNQLRRAALFAHVHDVICISRVLVKMADEEETIEIVEDEEEEEDEEEAAFDEVFEILAVNEELASALQESEEGVEFLQLCKDYIRSIKAEEEEYEETISQCQDYQDQLGNENGTVYAWFG